MVILHGEQEKRDYYYVNQWQSHYIQVTQCFLLYKSGPMAAHVNITCIFIILYVNSLKILFSVIIKMSLGHILSMLPKLSSLNQSSVQFSHSVLSDSSRPHGLQHARPSSPSPTPGAYSNSCH